MTIAMYIDKKSALALAREAFAASLRTIASRRQIVVLVYCNIVTIIALPFIAYVVGSIVLAQPFGPANYRIFASCFTFISAWYLAGLLVAVMTIVTVTDRRGVRCSMRDAAATADTLVHAALKIDSVGTMQLGLAALYALAACVAPAIVVRNIVYDAVLRQRAFSTNEVYLMSLVVVAAALGPVLAGYAALGMRYLLTEGMTAGRALAAARKELGVNRCVYLLLGMALSAGNLVLLSGFQFIATTLSGGVYFTVLLLGLLLCGGLVMMQTLPFVCFAERPATIGEDRSRNVRQLPFLITHGMSWPPSRIFGYIFGTVIFTLFGLPAVIGYLFSPSFSSAQMKYSAPPPDLRVYDVHEAQRQMRLLTIPAGFRVELKAGAAFSERDGIVSRISLVPLDASERFRMIIERVPMRQAFAREWEAHIARVRMVSPEFACDSSQTVEATIAGRSVALSERACTSSRGFHAANGVAHTVELAYAFLYTGGQEYAVWVTADPAAFRHEAVFAVLRNIAENTARDSTVSYSTTINTTVVDGLTIVLSNLVDEGCGGTPTALHDSSVTGRFTILNDSAHHLTVESREPDGHVRRFAVIEPARPWSTLTSAGRSWCISDERRCLMTVRTRALPGRIIVTQE